MRFILEIAGDLTPGLDAVSGAATIEDLVSVARDAATEVKGAQDAIAFVEKGPHAFQDLLVDSNPASFATFGAFEKLEDFEKAYGEAGAGFHYHHVVEQSALGRGITSTMINSTGNIIRIPELLHEEINAFYASTKIPMAQGRTFRDFVHGKSFDEQRRLGLWVLEQLHITH